VFHRVCVFRNGNRGEGPQEQEYKRRARPSEARVKQRAYNSQREKEIAKE